MLNDKYLRELYAIVFPATTCLTHKFFLFIPSLDGISCRLDGCSSICI